jgi:hypothetical protein
MVSMGWGGVEVSGGRSVCSGSHGGSEGGAVAPQIGKGGSGRGIGSSAAGC